MENSVVYFLVKKRSDGQLQSWIDDNHGRSFQFTGRMLPDRLARALRADGWPYFVVSVDLAVESPNILPRVRLA